MAAQRIPQLEGRVLNGDTIHDLISLVAVAEEKSKQAWEEPFHNQNDPDHRARCFHCLYEWWTSK